MSTEKDRKILLAHGGGGRLTAKLIEDTILPRFRNDVLAELGDSAKLDLASGKICFTTDSYVVKPLFFNGGDIGKLAVCGTVNDLAVAGAEPVALSLSLIIEEGFSVETLERILSSAAGTAESAGVSIVTGDTKVVEQGAADGIFINTAGVGVRREGVDLSFGRITPGDKIIVSGTIGDHGMTIMSQREEIKFETLLKSDCAALGGLTAELLKEPGAIKFMRDPTRGGVAATVNEIANSANVSVELKETSLPINPTVQAAADVLGFDLLNIANEGKVIIVADGDSAESLLACCRNHPLGKDAAIIGEVLESHNDPTVELVTKIGGRRMVQVPYGRELPRIC